MNAPALDLKMLTRTKERVADAGEVYTRFREVDAMLDLVGEVTYAEETTFLKPSCGNGQFLVAILGRKMRTIFETCDSVKDFRLRSLRALATISAVEILADSREECTKRLAAHMRGYFNLFAGEEPDPDWFWTVRKVLALKIVCGNFLAGGYTLHDLRVLDDLTILVREHQQEPRREHLLAIEKRRAKGPIFEDEAATGGSRPISKDDYLAAGVIFLD